VKTLTDNPTRGNRSCVVQFAPEFDRKKNEMWESKPVPMMTTPHIDIWSRRATKPAKIYMFSSYMSCSTIFQVSY